MTKKDYEFFAGMFAKLLKQTTSESMEPAPAELAILSAVNDFCEYAKRDNPRFNATKFRRAFIDLQHS